MRSYLSFRTVLSVCIVMLVAGCSEPPTEEMMQAEAALQAAQAEGAEDYVPDDYRAAADALADAKSKTESSDYDAALASALDAKQKADMAKAKVSAEKMKMRGELESTLTGMEQEWEDLMASSRKKRLNRATKASVDAARVAYSQLIADVREKVEAEDYVAAMSVMKEARMKATEIRELVDGS